MVLKHNSQVTPMLTNCPWLLSSTEESPSSLAYHSRPSMIWSLSTSQLASDFSCSIQTKLFPVHVYFPQLLLTLFRMGRDTFFPLFSHSVHPYLFKSFPTFSSHFKGCIVQEARDNFSPFFMYFLRDILPYVQAVVYCSLPVTSWSLYQGKDWLWYLSVWISYT